ncbi:hypothetical protein [Dysgonomonas sp. GY617]|uniref:hypothetical protein n=1 Tax=Dysgonomonas sp. GY617 TaxID=2780420 RepID=UPI00188473FF|nr:hypothetical protein [Dysgonomonas sp. GY617]MBF0577375.1 hypothetical protein [Dysgonomonas sp. GY617]
MSIVLYPDIQELNPDSLCYSIYTQLYNNFFNVQDKKDADHPYGVVEGDDTSIRLRNTAYNFADAISGAVGGSGGGNQGGVLIDYLKKSGGSMSGALIANYGFEAGYYNHRLMETYYRQVTDDTGILENYGVRFTQDVEIGARNLYIGGKQLLEYDLKNDATLIKSSVVNFEFASLLSSGSILVGNHINNGVFLSSTALLVNGKPVYHGGNSNNPLSDWEMKDGNLHGNLLVGQTAVIKGKLSARYGAELGCDGTVYLQIEKEIISLNSYLSFNTGYGIQIDSLPVLTRVDKQDVQIGAVGGDLHLGSVNTNRVILKTGIFDQNSQYHLITKYGGAYFPDSLTVRHNFGEELLSSYRIDNQDEGIIIHKRLRLGNSSNAFLSAKSNGIALTSQFRRYNASNIANDFEHSTILYHNSSTSYYQPLDRLSNSTIIETDTDFFRFSKSIEAEGHIGIDNSYTRLTKEGLFFSNEKYLLSGVDGIKHYGNSYFLDNISSEKFSSGFAGSGWAVIYSQTTGNITATFDELTIRKKMRIYELEVQKTNVTNGSLWISDNCCGDMVEKL